MEWDQAFCPKKALQALSLSKSTLPLVTRAYRLFNANPSPLLILPYPEAVVAKLKAFTKAPYASMSTVKESGRCSIYFHPHLTLGVAIPLLCHELSHCFDPQIGSMGSEVRAFAIQRQFLDDLAHHPGRVAKSLRSYLAAYMQIKHIWATLTPDEIKRSYTNEQEREPLPQVSQQLPFAS